MLGTGDADLFLTLSRGFHAQQLDAVADLVGELFFETYGRRGTLELVEHHTGKSPRRMRPPVSAVPTTLQNSRARSRRRRFG